MYIHTFFDPSLLSVIFVVGGGVGGDVSGDGRDGCEGRDGRDGEKVVGGYPLHGPWISIIR